MYKNFSENKENNRICYKTYCNIFKSEIIGLSRPSQVECEICLSYKYHIKDSDHNSDQCEECIAYAKHKVRHTQKLVLNTKSPSQRKLFVLPLICKELLYSLNSSQKNTYFVSRLVTFNQIFTSKTPNKADYSIQLPAVKHLMLHQRSCS